MGRGIAECAAAKGLSVTVFDPVEVARDSARAQVTASVGKDKKGVTPPKEVTSDGPSAFKGNLPGLYGGTMDNATCDAGQLVTYLDETPAKAAAWARVLDIDPSEIEQYVDELTPVTLRTDTRVTNHGYAGGRATPIQAVLQAGTAVFVNRYGTPVVKCYCGNPLTRPITYTAPTYTGPTWRGFSPSSITIIKQTITVVRIYRLYDFDGGDIFGRPAGTDGSQDVPPGGDVITTPEAPAVPATPTPPPATTPAGASESPTASFSPNPGRQGDTFTLTVSGFAPGATVKIALTRPDGTPESYSFSVGADGGGSYSFGQTSASVLTGTYSATVTNPQTGASAQATVQVDPA